MEVTKERFIINETYYIPNEERIIYMIDRRRTDDDGIPIPLTFFQSRIRRIKDPSIRSFLNENLKMIDSGRYDVQ